MPGPVPLRFWEDRAHRRDYMLWLAKSLRFRRMSDFYRLTITTVSQNWGYTPMARYWQSSPFCAVRDVFPEYEWLEWLFKRVPKGFWESRANRRRYLSWLGKRLGYKCADDWYALTNSEFVQNRGQGILPIYRSAPIRAVRELFPGRNWPEWKFLHVSAGFWDSAENRRRYLIWLGKELGFRRPEDWRRIRAYGINATLLDRFDSVADMLRKFLPNLDWGGIERRPITIDDIVAWADAYHAKHGKWPTQKSGTIPESGETWRRISRCLCEGFRGLPAGSSLPKLLQKHRGVGIGRRPPILTETRILDWAEAYYRAHGKWPTAYSASVDAKVNWRSGKTRYGMASAACPAVRA